MGEPDESTAVPVVVPRVSANDDAARLVEWLVADGTEVSTDQPVAVLDTTKTTFDLEAELDGFLFHLASEGDEVVVGEHIALISNRSQRPALAEVLRRPADDSDPEQIVTAKARAMIDGHGLAMEPFAGLAVVRTNDVERYLDAQASTGASDGGTAGGDEGWDGVLESDEYRRLLELLGTLRRRMRGRFHRHVPVGDLLSDRWELAAEQGFGEGTSVYDESLILGDVRVGRQCWVGPYTVLDGANAPLTIGDFTSIGTGSQLYTHDAIERTLTGNKASLNRRATTIGRCCFVAPQSIIGPGTVVGDHSFIASGSYVQGTFPPYSYIAGNPARRVGQVKVVGDRARLIREPDL